MMKRNLIISAIVSCFLLVVGCSNAWAIVFEKQDRIHISNLHRIDDDLYAWGSEIVVDGVLEGDLVAGANTVTINGYVKGSENVFASELHHTGRVDGSLRLFVWHAGIDGFVGRSALAYCGDFNLGKEAVIEKDAYLVAENVELNGVIKGNLEVRAKKVTLAGTISGDVTIKADNVTIVAPAVIKGNLTYTSPTEANIDVASGVTIIGNTVWNLPEEKSSEEGESMLTGIIIRIAKIFAAFLFGLIMLYVFRKYTTESVNQLRKRFAVAAATGFLAIIIVILSIIILLLSAVMMVAGLVLVSGDMALLGALILAVSILMIPIAAFAAVSGGVLFYSGKIALGILLGYWLIRFVKPSPVFPSRTQMFLGLLVITNFFYIPYIGILIYIVASIIGAGGIVLGIRNCRQESAAREIIPPPTDSADPSA